MEENPEDENSPIECAEINARNIKCNTISENKVDLSNHMKQTHGIKCDSCYEQVGKESDMKKHMKLFHQKVCLKCDSYHGKFKEIYCQNCSSNIKEEYSSSQFKRGRKCEYCNTIAANETDLKTHEKLKHRTCETCLMNFEGRNDLEIHNEIAHYFECWKCDKIYPTFKELIEHHMEREIQCGICHYSPSKENRDKHREGHIGLSGYFSCAYCEKSFVNYMQTVKHSFLHSTPAIKIGITKAIFDNFENRGLHKKSEETDTDENYQMEKKEINIDHKKGKELEIHEESKEALEIETKIEKEINIDHKKGKELEIHEESKEALEIEIKIEKEINNDHKGYNDLKC